KDNRRYVYAATDRFDEATDIRRSIRDSKFKLIYNGDTSSPVYKSVRYRKQMQTMQILDSLEKNRELNNFFSNWFSKRKNSFELYEVSKDYYELNNLISNTKYNQIYESLKHQLFKWINESDYGNMSEPIMLDSMFSNSMSIPKLNIPKLIQLDEGYLIKSNNLFASVGWRNKKEKVWKIYNEDELIQPKNDFEILIFKPGYEVFVKTFKK
ncbi:hypothetical protein OBB01_04835, partial [Bacteroidota bacterium]|nr:hypothetical protein [Bacteroidota bacterium]